MNRLLADFIATKNKSLSSDSISSQTKGYPCMKISYKDWLTVKRPSSLVLWMIEDHPDSDDIENHNTSGLGILPIIGKVFKGKTECMKNASDEPLVDVMLRHGWNGETQLWNSPVTEEDNNTNDTNKPSTDKPSEDTGGNEDNGGGSTTSGGKLVLMYDSANEFPKVGDESKLYFDRANRTVCTYVAETKEYEPIAELLESIIVDGTNEGTVNGGYKPNSPSGDGSTSDFVEENQLVYYYASKDKFPEVGRNDKLYYDNETQTLFGYMVSIGYKPVSELLETIIVEGTNEQ